jgi:hypothetical protein
MNLIKENKMNFPSSTKKYRPYFTISELREISNALRHYPAASFGKLPPIDLLRYIDRYILDIESGYRKENSINLPSLEARLELEDSAPQNLPKLDGKILYTAWQANATLTPRELEAVLEYRYLNDLMTPTEEKAYETKNGITY